MATVAKLRDTVQDLINFDFETGGKSSKKNPATEIFLLAIRGDDFTEIARCHVVFLPYDDKLVYEDKALEITDISMEYINKNGVSIAQALEKIYKFFEEVSKGKSAGYLPKLVAHNLDFDKSFLAQIFSYGKYKLEKVLSGNIDHFGNFNPNGLDTLSLARDLWNNDPEITDYKLAKVAERLGIQLVNAHRAEQDVLVLREVIVNMIEAMRNGLYNQLGTESVKIRLREVEDYKI